MTRLITPRKAKLVSRIASTEGRVRHLEVNGSVPPVAPSGGVVGLSFIGVADNSPCPHGGQSTVPLSTLFGSPNIPVTGVYLVSIASFVFPQTVGIFTAANKLGAMQVNGFAPNSLAVGITYVSANVGVSMVYAYPFSAGDVITFAVVNAESFDLRCGVRLTVIRLT